MTTTTRQPSNWTFTGRRYESDCPCCGTRMVRYHADAPDCTMADTYAQGTFTCPMCDAPLYVNRVEGTPDGKII